MNYIKRNVSKKILQLFNHFPVVTVIGARQVGKTTLLQNMMKDKADYVVFDPVMDIENARQDPELFLNSHSLPLILDEIQYAPELIAVIKRKIDRDRKPGQYLLTGSQQWGVLKSMSESLAGRVAIIILDGFDLRESSEITDNHFWIEQYLKDTDNFLKQNNTTIHPKYKLVEHIFRGWLPEAVQMPVGLLSDFFSSYIRTYIERDVRLMSDISNLHQFGRFFRLLGALSAQEINFSHLGREIGVTPQTGKRWVDIMASNFQWYELPAFSGNIIKRISGKAKGYMSDSGLICHALAISSPTALLSHPMWGNVFESMAVADIIKQIRASGLAPNLYHWRAHSGAEVDLIMEMDGKYYPLEIKAASRPSKNAAKGISAFRKSYPNLKIEKGIVLCPCESIYPINKEDFAVPVLCR